MLRAVKVNVNGGDHVHVHVHVKVHVHVDDHENDYDHVDVNVNVNVRVHAVSNFGPPHADNEGMLSFQRLDVYQRAVQFLALTTEILEELPRGHADRADQLARAAESVVRNIAEAAGRWSDGDSSKHYRIARGEAMECAASLDVLQLRKLITTTRHQRGLELLEAIVAMLTRMI